MIVYKGSSQTRSESYYFWCRKIVKHEHIVFIIDKMEVATNRNTAK